MSIFCEVQLRDVTALGTTQKAGNSGSASLKLQTNAVPFWKYSLLFPRVKGFNMSYESLSPSNKMDIYNSYIKTYLSQQSHPTGECTKEE